MNATGQFFMSLDSQVPPLVLLALHFRGDAERHVWVSVLVPIMSQDLLIVSTAANCSRVIIVGGLPCDPPHTGRLSAGAGHSSALRYAARRSSGPAPPRSPQRAHWPDSSADHF